MVRRKSQATILRDFESIDPQCARITIVHYHRSLMAELLAD